MTYVKMGLMGGGEGGVGMGGKCKRMNASMGKHTIGAVRAACWVPAYSGCAYCVPLRRQGSLPDVYKCQQLSAASS